MTEVEVFLREVAESDLGTHFEQQNDPESIALAAVPGRDRPAFDAQWAKVLADPECVVLTVVADGEVAGSAVSFVRAGRRLVGYWIGREHWGRRIASAALAQLVDTEVTERPLWAEVVTHNGASRRVLEKCGFEVVEERQDSDARVWVLRLD